MEERTGKQMPSEVVQEKKVNEETTLDRQVVAGRKKKTD